MMSASLSRGPMHLPLHLNRPLSKPVDLGSNTGNAVVIPALRQLWFVVIERESKTNRKVPGWGCMGINGLVDRRPMQSGSRMKRTGSLLSQHQCTGRERESFGTGCLLLVLWAASALVQNTTKLQALQVVLQAGHFSHN